MSGTSENKMSQSGDSAKPVFRELDADDPEPETTEIESLCMNCGENVSSSNLITIVTHLSLRSKRYISTSNQH